MFLVSIQYYHVTFFSHLNRHELAYYYGFNLYFFKDGLFKLSTLTYVIRYENIFVGPSLSTNVLSIISSSNIYYHMLLVVFHVEDEYIRRPPWAARDRYQISWAADTVSIIDTHALRQEDNCPQSYSAPKNDTHTYTM